MEVSSSRVVTDDVSPPSVASAPVAGSDTSRVARLHVKRYALLHSQLPGTVVGSLVAAGLITLLLYAHDPALPLWPWLAFGEPAGKAALIGGAIIVGAVLISIFGGRFLVRGARKEVR